MKIKEKAKKMKFRLNITPISVNQLYNQGFFSGKWQRYSTTAYKQWQGLTFYQLPKIETIIKEVQVNYQFYLSKNYSRTDLGNLEKALSDIIVKKKIIKDDSQIQQITMSKFRSKEDYILIEIEELKEEDETNIKNKK